MIDAAVPAWETRRGDARTRALPKAHLHVHLERAYRPATLTELAARAGIALDGFHDFADLPGFLNRRPAIRPCIATPDDLRRVCREFVEDEAADGVLYSEPMAVLHRWPPSFGTLDAVYDLVWGALREAGRACGVEVGIMVGFARHRDTPAEAEALARFAASRAGAGIVGFGFGGDEALVGPAAFARACAIARAAGLLIVPHAGEVTGPADVTAALDALRPDRIAHGIRAAADPRVLARLAAEGVVCDVCPTSNVRLGNAPTLAAHPLAAMLAAGVPVTLGSDDPLDFGVTVAEEYARVRDALGLPDATLARIAETSATASGASPTVKARIVAGARRWLTGSAEPDR